MRLALLFAALLLSACSSTQDVPTPEEAEAALEHSMRLTWTTTAASARAPIRVGRDGKLIALVPSGTPPAPLRAPRPPAISVDSLNDCVTEGDTVACDTSYRMDGAVQSRARVRYWRHGSDWRARFLDAG